MTTAHEPERHTAFDEHLSECAECRANPGAIIALHGVLRAHVPEIGAARLSHRVLAAAGPELRRRRQAVDWRRLAAAVLGSLIPLPLVLAVNALVIALVHFLLTILGFPALANYVVASYLVGLVFVLGATYAAIPVLVERSAGPRLLPLA